MRVEKGCNVSDAHCVAIWNDDFEDKQGTWMEQQRGKNIATIKRTGMICLNLSDTIPAFSNKRRMYTEFIYACTSSLSTSSAD